MADLLAKAVFKIGSKLYRTLGAVKENRKDGNKFNDLIDLVQIVCDDVKPLQEDVRLEGNPATALAMSKLKDALVEAEREVSQYLNARFVFQAVNVDAMTKKLRTLREQVRDQMDAAHLATDRDTNSEVRRIGHYIYNNLRHDIHDAVRSAVGTSTDPKAVTYEPPRVLTQIDLCLRQKKDMETVKTVLSKTFPSIPLGVAAVLLRCCHWTPELIKKEWSSSHQQRDKLRKAVGLPSSSADGGYGPKELSHISKYKCEICFDDVAARTTVMSAGCSHYYCKCCWRGYISLAVRDGMRCLWLRCPDPSCSAPVTKELVDKVASSAERTRYDQLALRSYVDDSGGRIKWCPGLHCDRAVEFLGGPDAKDVVAVCDCKVTFCWSCGEEPHRPLPCSMARFWLDTISSRNDWVLMFLKRCPKCLNAIENDMWTNHVTCRVPGCGHQFCWICLHPMGAGVHTVGCELYKHLDKYYYSGKEVILKSFVEKKGEDMVKSKKGEHQKAVASRYYELWEANRKSLQEALEEMDILKRQGLKNMANVLGIADAEAADLDFLSQAYEEITACRRAIRWVYPYGYYYLDPKRDGDKCQKFEHLHKEAKTSLDSLQSFAELERMKLYGVEPEDMSQAYADFKAKVMELTRETRDKVESLVRAAQADTED